MATISHLPAHQVPEEMVRVLGQDGVGERQRRRILARLGVKHRGVIARVSSHRIQHAVCENRHRRELARLRRVARRRRAHDAVEEAIEPLGGRHGRDVRGGACGRDRFRLATIRRRRPRCRVPRIGHARHFRRVVPVDAEVRDVGEPADHQESRDQPWHAALPHRRDRPGTCGGSGSDADRLAAAMAEFRDGRQRRAAGRAVPRTDGGTTAVAESTGGIGAADGAGGEGRRAGHGRAM